ncbi:tetratricopeptide repeat protein [Maridesulfovibrio bastinii]|uniref:tetratricopeptide repeat protein n=1 Tax=Maridesulfovibrio bastinii TaxID=47157 RepID=UPI000423D5E4|nr:hypothetical protein [Maridesulfovibrio bastinii]
MSTAKSIREHVARAKAYAQRKDYMRCLNSLSLSLEELADSQIFGREKFEIGILIDEVFRQMLAMDELKKVLPRSLKYSRGQEKKLAQVLRKIHDTIKAALERAAEDKIRKMKNQIDKYILAGQKALDEKNLKDGKKYFRKITDACPDEEGLLQDVGSRLVKSGFPRDGIEFLERAIEKNAGDSRPYISLVLAWEMLGETDNALNVLNDIMRRFGANESLYVRQAKLYFAKRMYTEAYDAATAALNSNPLNRDAKKMSDMLGPKIFGRGYQAGVSSKEAKKSSGKVSLSLDGGESKPKAKSKAKAKPANSSKTIKLDF